MAELFGFSFNKKETKGKAPSPIQPSSDDGATSYIAGGVTPVGKPCVTEKRLGRTPPLIAF